jgi:hypothetical protein
MSVEDHISANEYRQPFSSLDDGGYWILSALNTAKLWGLTSEDC